MSAITGIPRGARMLAVVFTRAGPAFIRKISAASRAIAPAAGSDEELMVRERRGALDENPHRRPLRVILARGRYLDTVKGKS